MKSLWSLAFVLLLCSSTLKADVLLGFEGGSTDYTNNFRVVATGGTVAVSSDGTSNNALSFKGGGLDAIYDTTPANATVQNTFSTANSVTVNFQFQENVTGSSIGLFFINPSDETSSTLVLLKLGTGASDSINFFTGNPSMASNYGAGTGVGTAKTGDAGVDLGSYANVSITYAANGQISVSLGSLATTYTVPAGTALSNLELGFRFYNSDTTTSNYIDNFTVSVPEPSPWALAAGGIGVVALLSRNLRKSVGT